MKCLLVGSTGLIGNHLLDELINDSNFTEITVLVRKKIEISNKKLKQIIFDFDNIENYINLGKFDIVFSCLGTTIKIAKSKDNFKKVDLQYPLNIAKNVKTKQFFIVSSMGANIKSLIFYSKIKGELEEELKKLNFATLCIFRPSQLKGKRKEFRKNEIYSIKLMKIFNFFIPNKYKAIEGLTVAKAMKTKAIENKNGTFTFLSDEIKHIATNEN